jgi:hypothetical protein
MARQAETGTGFVIPPSISGRPSIATGAHGCDQAALFEPGFVAGEEFGRDGGEFFLQCLNLVFADRVDQRLYETFARDEAAAFAEVEVGQFPDRATVEGEGEFLELVQSSGRKGAADDGADRGSRNDRGFEPGGDQCAQDTDMCPTARAASAKCHSDTHGR